MSLSKDLIFLILQFCNEENLTKTAHMLEQETGFFFDMEHFEHLVLSGSWDETENYLSSFTGVSDNKFSTKMFFEIRKQKFLEALDRQDRKTALDILLKDLKVFAPSNEELYKEMAQLLTLDDFREYAPLAQYGDIISARKLMMRELKLIIESNPQFKGRLRFPELNKSRLRRLINQSLNWQHMHCANPQLEPEIETLFTDHKCPGPEYQSVTPCEQRPRPSKTLSDAEPAFPQLLTSNSSIVTDDMVSATTSKAVQDSGNLYDVSSTRNMNEKVLATGVTCQKQAVSSSLSDDFPKAVRRVLNIGSSPTTMDFHPVQQTLLIVGNSFGGIELWDVSSEEKLFSRKFMLWKVEAVSTAFLVHINEDPLISVTRVLWSSDGSLFGVAYSKSIVQLYSYYSSNNHAEKHLEIEAHYGSVNDLAFSKPNNQLLLVTCGEDKLIQVWNTITGAKQYTFEGHGAPVYSLCAHAKENVHFIFSTSSNAEIKAWLFDNLGPRVSYEAPGNCCMRMLYSADGKRLFSCGTNKDRDSHIVEWNEAEGYIERNYTGVGKSSLGIIPFDISNNKYLAAGDAHVIKVWNVNDAQMLTVVDAGGDLPASPYIRFNKKGTLLAVFADHNRIKILANDCGRFLLQTSSDASRYLSDSIRKLASYSLGGPSNTSSTDGTVPPEKVADNLANMEPHRILGTQSISKVVQVSRCQFLRLPSEVKTNRVWRLMYTHAGNALLALVADGIHLLWRWSKSGSNLSGQTTTKSKPQLWQPRNGVSMTNSLPSSDKGAVSPCVTLSKNDSYAISASGGMVSVFNLLMFKKMKSFMPPEPAATCIAFHPSDNNVIAVGMDDSSIVVYNVRLDEVIIRLEGHSKRISGLAFSSLQPVLVSSGADSQIVVWDSLNWKRERSTLLQISADWIPTELSETFVQFHQDQEHFLVVHETQIAIYETTKLECVKQWIIKNFCARISHATFSCDCQWIYAVMKDGIVLILSASDLSPKFEIDPSTFLPSDFSAYVIPLVVAAHPQNPNQFALGLTDGGVVIIEPPESEGRWLVHKGDDNNDHTK
uniref:Topless-related protein 1 n=1 Tax=Nicotiana tabacum TaxID=4097 RepID=A0A1S4CFS9_TOBAC|nr:PREDICTED: topless-related protein 1-like [Nicotiana tabacum]XP_016500038.1 PREDICTED: topless-related protein 1-like [Nicotiana tabacum]XP_016500039.1 PREDICTED: topless-related protein 1-like [Nicotiana tabacum]